MDALSGGLFEHQRVVVDRAQAPLRLDLFLMRRLASVTRHRIQRAVQGGAIQVNGAVVKASYKVRPHDVVQVMLPEPPRNREVLPEALPLEVVYEDEEVLVVNKAAEMVVHPAHANWSGTLVNALVHRVGLLPTRAGNEGRPGLVHRLDKGTSGLLVVGKTEGALAALARQFAAHTVQRRYTALVWGLVAEEAGTIAVPLGRSPHDRRVMVSYEGREGGKAAVTHYRVLERFSYTSLLECTLETGRTHQIRAHMKHIGHPLFGDLRYGGDQVVAGPCFSKYAAFVRNCFSLLPHHALHAGTLGFLHPVTRRLISLEAPLPLPLSEVISRWRRYRPV